MDFSKGGKACIDRMITAYDVSSRVQLATRLGTSASSLSNRYLRDVVPADLLVQCALETGAPLEWLVFGDGEFKTEGQSASQIRTSLLEKFSLIDGELSEDGSFALDASVHSKNSGELIAVKHDNLIFIVNRSFKDISNGEWLTDIDGVNSINNLIRIPGNKVRFGGEIPFECGINDFAAVGKVIGKIEAPKE